MNLSIHKERTRVLLAEDDRELRRLIAGALREDGYEVLEASNGGELVDHLGAMMLSDRLHETPHLIISDIHMPGMSGMYLLAGLQNSSVHVPIILMTAFGDEDTHETAERLGAVAFFDKPFRIKDLKHTVHVLREPSTWVQHR